MGHMPVLGNPDHHCRYKKLSLTLHCSKTQTDDKLHTMLKNSTSKTSLSLEKWVESFYHQCG